MARICRRSPRTGWSWSPGACEQMVGQRWERSQATSCVQKCIFSQLCWLQKPLYIRRIIAATQIPKTCEVRALLTTALVLPVAGPFLGLHTKAGWIPVGCLPFPRGKSTDSLTALCHGALWPLNPCSSCVQLTPAPSCSVSECAFKRYSCKGWENLRVILP